jgi:hypothetical protein
MAQAAAQAAGPLPAGNATGETGKGEVPQPAAATTGATVGALDSKDPIWKKPEVELSSIDSNISSTYDSIVSVWKDNKAPTPVITSGNDGIHRGSNKKGTDCSTAAKCRETSSSLHYKNKAIDLRANNVTETEAQKLADDLQKKLGDKYEVVLEKFTNKTNNHIHIEYEGD